MDEYEMVERLGYQWVMVQGLPSGMCLVHTERVILVRAGLSSECRGRLAREAVSQILQRAATSGPTDLAC